MYQGRTRLNYSWEAILQFPLLNIEAASLHKQSVHLAAPIGRGQNAVLVHIFKFEAESEDVYGNVQLSRLALQHRGQKALGEEERGQPKGLRALVQPASKEVRSLLQIVEPRGQGFERGIGVFVPQRRDLILSQTQLHPV